MKRTLNYYKTFLSQYLNNVFYRSQNMKLYISLLCKKNVKHSKVSSENIVMKSVSITFIK